MIIIGLGNPDKKYERTYHNVGFMCLDAVAEKLQQRVTKKECLALTSESFIGGRRVVLAKPQTYMNLSGDSVRRLIDKYGRDEDIVLVLYDDIDLPLGHVRMRLQGSAGTHNGMRSIVATAGEHVARIRVGIGRPTIPEMDLVDFVLHGMDDTTLALIRDRAQKIAECIYTYITKAGDIESLQREVNSLKCSAD